jgi:hypothetical protein
MTLPWKPIARLRGNMDASVDYLLHCWTGFYDKNVLIRNIEGQWFEGIIIMDESVIFEHFTHFIEITPPCTTGS